MSRAWIVVLVAALTSACAPTSAEMRQAEATRTVDNPLMDAFGGPLAISSIEVRYPDDAFDDSLDRATMSYVEDRMLEDQRAAFSAFAAARGDAPDAMAERFSEYLAEADLRQRFAAPEGGRSLKLALSVEGTEIKGLIAHSFNPTFPTTDVSFTLTDAEDGALFASGYVRRCGSTARNIEAARDAHDLQLGWMGSNTMFRMMAGMTNALAGCVRTLTITPTFPTDPATVAVARSGEPFFVSMPIRLDEPIYEISLAQETANELQATP